MSSDYIMKTITLVSSNITDFIALMYEQAANGKFEDGDFVICRILWGLIMLMQRYINIHATTRFESGSRTLADFMCSNQRNKNRPDSPKLGESGLSHASQVCRAQTRTRPSLGGKLARLLKSPNLASSMPKLGRRLG